MKVTIEVPDKTIGDTLCSGMEGGIGYWSQIVDYKKPESLEFRTMSGHTFRHIDYPMNKGGAVILIDLENNDKRHTLTLKKLHKGVQIMAEKYPRHFADMVNESGDATTGDVLVQCALFGETLYG